MITMKAAILTTGDEIVTGRIVDTNEAYIAEFLDKQGIQVMENRAIRDDKKKLIRTLLELISEVDLIVVTGGLGPTLDDITAETVASLQGCSLERYPKSVKKIHERYEQRKRKVTDISLRQAEYPESCTPLCNPVGLAVGFRMDFLYLPPNMRRDEGAAFFFPGVPQEMKRMVSEYLNPWILRQNFKKKDLYEFFLFGLPEAVIAEKIESSDVDLNKFEFSISFKDGIADIRLHRDQAISAQERRDFDAEMQKLFSKYLLPEDASSFADLVHRTLIKHKKSLALAESCTGGWIAKTLTDRPGSSAYLRQGWVSYSNESKTELLSVDASLIKKYGAVSEEVVQEMLRGALKSSGCDFSIAVSGIAGPDGGSREKPVGTVYIGVAARDKAFLDGGNFTGSVKLYNFPGDRDRVRLQSVQQSLALLWDLYLRDL